MGLSVPDAAIVEAGLLAGAFTIVGIVGTKFPPLPGRSLRTPASHCVCGFGRCGT